MAEDAAEEKSTEKEPLEEEEEEEKYQAELLLPKAGVKRIMKLDPDTNNVSQDAVLAMGRATEMFVEKLAKRSKKIATQQKRKTIKYDDIATARTAERRYDFLNGVIPKLS